MTPRQRNARIALTIVAIVTLGVASYFLYRVNTAGARRSDTISSTSSGLDTSKTLEELKVPSKLDGTLVSESLAKRHPLGVMIENHPDARPQSGLGTASIVYEAIAEGGITRFLALYGPYNAEKVGPIRSARTYYVDWCDEYDCFYAHVGGNDDALHEKIPSDKVKDLDQFANGSTYHREPKAGLATEHTMYSSTDLLYALAATKKWSTAVRETYNIYPFLDDPKTPLAPTNNAIGINFSSAQYAVKYTYIAATNSYARFMDSKAHVDANTNKQISVKNIIIQNMPRTATVTKINEQGWVMPTVGSGIATVYQGGQKIVGTWKKKDSFSRTEFRDSTGALIDLYRGATWIEVVNPGSVVTDSAS